MNRLPYNFVAAVFCCAALASCSKRFESSSSVSIEKGVTIFRKEAVVEISSAAPISAEACSRIHTLADFVSTFQLGAKDVAYVWPEGLTAFHGRIELMNGPTLLVFDVSDGAAKLRAR